MNTFKMVLMSTLIINAEGRSDGVWGSGTVDDEADKTGMAEMTGDT